MKRATILGLLCGLIAVLLSWLISSETSPLYNYFLWHGTIPSIWEPMNFTVVIASAFTGIRSTVFSAIVIFFQWFFIGFIASWFLLKIRKEKDRVER